MLGDEQEKEWSMRGDDLRKKKNLNSAMRSETIPIKNEMCFVGK